MTAVPDTDIERCLLATTLHDKAAWIEVGPIVTPEMFCSTKHRILWCHIGEFYAAGGEADPVALALSLEKSGALADAGGREYLASVHNEVFAHTNASLYAEEVRARAVKRWYIAELSTITRLAGEPERSVDEIEAATTEALQRIAAGRPAHTRSFSEMLGGAFQDMLGSRLFDDRSVPTGFPVLDGVLNGGMKPGQLVLLAARPSVGKSSLAYTVAFHVACALKKHALLFTLEVTGAEVCKCLIASAARVDTRNLNRGTASENDKARLVAASESFAGAPLTIDDSSYTMPRLASVARSVNHQQRLALVIVDYLGLIAPGKELENRQNEVAFVSRALKMLAKELDVPILALAQLNREVEKRSSGRPTLADLRDSGSLEQDADVVLMIHRHQKDGADRHQIIVAKNRHGEANRDIEMEFEKQYLRWSSRTQFEAGHDAE